MHLNAYVGYVYRPIVTKVGICVFLGGMYYMPQSVFRNFDFFSILSPVLEFEKLAFIYVCAHKIKAYVSHVIH